MALTDTAHEQIRKHFAGVDLSNKIAADATCGNGNDTVFLSSLGFNNVLGFDVQPQALQTTRKKLAANVSANFELILDSHVNLANYVQGQLVCVMFNLGYLPNADKSIATQATTTLLALEGAKTQLDQTGIISLLCYPGHPQGAEETNEIQGWLKSLDKRNWKVREILASHPSSKAPVLYLISRQQP